MGILDTPREPDYDEYMIRLAGRCDATRRRMRERNTGEDRDPNATPHLPSRITAALAVELEVPEEIQEADSIRMRTAEGMVRAVVGRIGKDAFWVGVGNPSSEASTCAQAFLRAHAYHLIQYVAIDYGGRAVGTHMEAVGGEPLKHHKRNMLLGAYGRRSFASNITTFMTYAERGGSGLSDHAFYEMLPATMRAPLDPKEFDDFLGDLNSDADAREYVSFVETANEAYRHAASPRNPATSAVIDRLERLGTDVFLRAAETTYRKAKLGIL